MPISYTKFRYRLAKSLQNVVLELSVSGTHSFRSGGASRARPTADLLIGFSRDGSKSVGALVWFLCSSSPILLLLGCSITYRYSYWCSPLTAKIDLMVFCSCCVLRGEPEIWNFFYRLSVYELAGNEIFLRHWSSGNYSKSSQGRLYKRFMARVRLVILAWHLVWPSILRFGQVENAGPVVCGPGVWKTWSVENMGRGKHGVWWKTRGVESTGRGKHGI